MQLYRFEATRALEVDWESPQQLAHVRLYIEVMGLDLKLDARNVALLLTIAGLQTINVYNALIFVGEEDRLKLDMVPGKFEARCSPKKNETHDRYVFCSRLQQLGESFASCLIDLKIKAQSCNSHTLKDLMIRDQNVFGLKI